LRKLGPFLILACILVFGGNLSASSDKLTPTAKRILTEAEAKAAFVLNFARFTEWPEGALPVAQQPIRIGVSGQSPLSDELQRLSKGFLIQGHVVEIVVLENPEDRVECNVLLIENAERDTFLRYLATQAGKNVLVVGDKPETAKWGAAIAFHPFNARLQFIVNRKAAHEHGLTFSSQLLKLAASITD